MRETIKDLNFLLKVIMIHYNLENKTILHFALYTDFDLEYKN